MVNSVLSPRLASVWGVVCVYVVVALGTVAALIVLSTAAPALATAEAWGHAVVVAVFAIVLALRARVARTGSASGLRAVTIIGSVLLVVNLVEATLPGVFPPWMRVEMVGIAGLMLVLLVLAVRARSTR